MKSLKAATAVAGLALGLLAAGCNDYNNSIQNPTGATITNVSPVGVAAGAGDFTLTVNGSALNGFQTNTVIEWNGQTLKTTYMDTQTLTAAIPAAMVTTPGTVLVRTLTPQTGAGNNGLSNTWPFYIYGTPNPVPTITGVSPASTTACGSSCSSLTITVTGTNFLPTSQNGGSVVAFQDMLTPQQQPAALNITSLSATQIVAVVPAAYLPNPDGATITVVNPPNGVCTSSNCLPLVGGGTSNAICFMIGGVACPASAAQETPAVSQDGRYVAYAAVQNQVNQILVKDTCVGAPNGCTQSTELVSAATDGTPGNAESHDAAMSGDARYVAFSSSATNLVEGSPSGRQVYLRDTCIGAANSCKPSTTLISTDAAGALSGLESILPSINANGRYVAFVAVTPKHTAATGAPSLSIGPNSGLREVFVRDTCLGASGCTPKTTRISLAPGDKPADAAKPVGAAISGLAKQIALPDGKSATVFTPSVPVSEEVVLAEPKQQ